MCSQMTVTHISGQILTLMARKTVHFGADAPFAAAEKNPVPSPARSPVRPSRGGWGVLLRFGQMNERGGGVVFTEPQADNRQNIPSAQLIYVDGRVFVGGCHMTFAPKFPGNRDDSHATPSNPCVSGCEALVQWQE